jgi:hypothetical protein
MVVPYDQAKPDTKELLMASRDSFTPNEWAAVVKAAMAPATIMAVTVDFNLFALARKLEAFWDAVNTYQRISSSFLVHDICKQVSEQRKSSVKGVSENEASDWLKEQEQGSSLRAVLPGMLREAMGILRYKADQEEIEAYRDFILGTTDAVARASHDKGLFANKGDLISEDEIAFINEIRVALGR